MAKTLVRRSHFFEPLERLFDRTTTDWFVGLDHMIEDMSARWDRAIEEFRELPHSSVEKIDEQRYRVTIDVAGFERKELKVSMINDELRVEGNHEEEQSEGESKSSERSSFHQSFLLAEGMKVESVRMDGEDLKIDLSIPKPPEPKVKTFEIS